VLTIDSSTIGRGVGHDALGDALSEGWERRRWKIPQTSHIAHGGLEALQRTTAPTARVEMAPHPTFDLQPQFTVVEVVQPASGAATGTVSEHSCELHDHFDAETTVIDPPATDISHSSADDLEDFLAIVERYERRLSAVIARLLDDPRDVEEALQDCFVQAWRHRGDFRSEAAVFTWLYRIATNTALMRLRRRRAQTVAIDDLSAIESQSLSDDPLEGHPELLVLVARVRDALGELSEHQRIIVLLRDVEGLSNAETAAALGLPITTVKAHLHRGRAALRRRLHPA
jgi:RNA polymerase sigma-70 factor, ECF subfamily